MSTGLKIVGTGIFFAGMSAGFYFSTWMVRKCYDARLKSLYKKATDVFCNTHYGCYGGFADCDNNENE